MQHDEPENDADLCKKVHNSLNNITEAATPGKTATAGGAPASAGDPSAQN